MINHEDATGEVSTGSSDVIDVNTFFERVCELSVPYQILDVQQVLFDAVRSSLSTAEICQLEHLIAKRTEISPRALREATKIAENSHDDHGLLRRTSDFAAAMVKEITDTFSVTSWVGGSLYGYQETSDDGETSREAGSFVRMTPPELERNILEVFKGHDLVQRKSARADILSQVATTLRDDDFFSDAAAGLCASNGFVSWLPDGGVQLIEHSADHKARVKLQCDFRPSACFEWFEQRLRATMRDQSSVEALQEFAGAILFNIVPAKDEARRICLLIGPQNSGKSTMISILQGLLPPEVVDSIAPDEWSQEKYRAKLEGVALNVVPELGAQMRIPAVQLKKMGSREPVTARRLYGDPFTFRPIARHLFATNELPRIPDKSNASGRRILCISFDRSLAPDEVDPDFVSKVVAEPSAFINWAAVGAQRLFENQRFTIPTGQDETAAIMQHGDDVAAILAYTRIEAARGERLTSLELQEALRRISEDLDFDPQRVNDGTMKRLSGLLQKLYGGERKQSSGRPFYLGVRFRDGAHCTVDGLGSEVTEMDGQAMRAVDVDLANL